MQIARRMPPAAPRSTVLRSFLIKTRRSLVLLWATSTSLLDELEPALVLGDLSSVGEAGVVVLLAGPSGRMSRARLSSCCWEPTGSGIRYCCPQLVSLAKPSTHHSKKCSYNETCLERLSERLQ